MVQVLVYPISNSIANVKVDFNRVGDLPASAFSCFQTEGVNYRGERFTPPAVTIRKHEVGQLLISVAPSTLSGVKCGVAHNGTFTITPDGMKAKEVSISVTITCANAIAAKAGNSGGSGSGGGGGGGGDGDGSSSSSSWSLNRMAWLNSQVGGNSSTITRPYSPITLTSSSIGSSSSSRGSRTVSTANNDEVLHCRGRTVAIGDTGLPSSITSNGRNVLAGPITFNLKQQQLQQQQQQLASLEHGEQQKQAVIADTWVVVEEGSTPVILGPGGATAHWTRVLSSGGSKNSSTVRMVVEGTMSYDGHLDFAVSVTSPSPPSSSSRPAAAAAAHNNAADDVADDGEVFLSVPVSPTLAKYANGAGFGSDGGYFPTANVSKLDWKWAAPIKPGGPPVPAGGPVGGSGWRVWLGDVDAGLFLKLKGADLSWNRNNGGVDDPESWSNGGKGGIRVNKYATITAYTGLRTTRADRSNSGSSAMLFNFSLLATPVKGDYTSTATSKREHYVESRHYHIKYVRKRNISTCQHYLLN